MRRRTLLKAFLGSAALGGSGWWVARSALEEYASAGLAFGTTVSLRVLHDDASIARAALAAAISAVQDVDRLMSLYRTDSQLSALNRDGRLDQPDPRLVAVLEEAQAVSAATDGAFDVTVQPLWQAASQQADPRRTLAQVGWRRMMVTSEAIWLDAPGMAVTLNGIAQGYGADAALAALRAHGIQHALLDTGELATLGVRDDGAPWTLGIRDPRSETGIAQALQADGRCLATSGDYASAFSADYSRHHIFDPRTGNSPEELASVSVLAPTGMAADALSTACMVLGAERAMQLAARMPGVDLLCVGKDGRQLRSAGFPRLPAST